ncbi:FecR domain-containing protein [Chitinophaga lutea]
MFNNDQIDSLIARDIEGELTGAERAQLEAWLREDESNRQYYQALKETWSLSAEAFDHAPEPDVEANWQRFRPVMDEAPLRVASKNRTWWRPAVAAAVIVAAAGLTFALLRGNETVVVADATEQEAVLPDGSKIFLNRHSKIRYAKGFAQSHRTVELEGEAFFDVQPNSSQPFIVRAGASQTQVLGTSFVIRAYADKAIRLNVVTGKVAFSGKEKKAEPLVLTAGHAAVLRGDKAPQQEAGQDPNFMAWKEDRLNFSEVPIYQVLGSVEDYFGVRIIVDDKSLLNKNFSGTFDHPGLQEILDVIGTAAGVKVTKVGPDEYRMGQ